MTRPRETQFELRPWPMLVAGILIALVAGVLLSEDPDPIECTPLEYRALALVRLERSGEATAQELELLEDARRQLRESCPGTVLE